MTQTPMTQTPMTQTPMTQTQEGSDRIAVVGMAGRFPGAGTVTELWDLLITGREGISRLGEQEMLDAGEDPDLVRHDDYVPAKGVLEGADLFDAGFFGFTPREAQVLDPQHRVLLECAWEALEDAGCVPARFPGRIGIFAGAAFNTYLLANVMQNRRVSESVGRYQTLLASDKDFLVTRAAYKLGLRGPAVTVQTACSTSLTAVHLACQSLLDGECDIALAGGVTVSVPLQQGYLYESGGIASPDGHCRPFDARAAGTVPGNGVGLVVFRRLEDAVANGDGVDAVILGSAVNNDGSHKAGYTAPSVDGQSSVIGEALAVAGVDAASIDYVETHGTATALGDPIEIAALTQTFRRDTDTVGSCAIGSVKANLGHLDAASGVTGLIKTVLMLRHGAIPPSPHFEQPNPQLELATSPFQVVREVQPWPRRETPRRAGVSSFGIGGTNVHVVLEEAPALPVNPIPAQTGHPVLLPLSARTPQAVADGAGRLADHLEQDPNAALVDVARTLLTRRETFACRRAVVGRTREEVVAALRGFGPTDAVTAAERPPRVVFLFPGQGAQHPGMARDLYGTAPAFAAALDECAEMFAAELGFDLRDLILAGVDEEADAAQRLAQTAITQPALFCVEYALAQLWGSWGVHPSAMVGHSIGEYVAACLAGVFSLPDAVRLVAARGRLVQAMPPGTMLTVFRSEAEVERLLEPGLTVAAVNSTGLCVVSGPNDAIDALAGQLDDSGVAARRLRTSHAFHSASMDDAVEPLHQVVATARLSGPSIPFCSNVTGRWITDEEAVDPGYWARHLRAPVRFAEAAGTLLAEPETVFVEVGPGRGLTTFLGAHEAWTAGRVALTTLPRAGADDAGHTVRALGQLWATGVTVDLPGTDDPPGARTVRLPAYPFQRERYWVTPDGDVPPGRTAPDVAAATDVRRYVPGWRRLVPREVTAPATDASAEVSVVWGNTSLAQALTDSLADRAERSGAPGSVVRIGADLSPDDVDRLVALLEPVVAQDPSAVRIVHALGLEVEPAPLGEEQLRRARRTGLDSVLALAQAVERVRPPMPVTVDVLCRGVYDVTGEESLQPENATVAGICTVIPQEIPGVQCRLIDVSGVDPAAPPAQAVTDLLDLLGRPTPSQELALRGRHWWSREYDPAPETVPEGAPPPRLRSDGLYLVTGGLGGIGLALAEHLAVQGERPVLALLGRSPFPEPAEWDAWVAEHGPDEANSARIARLRGLAAQGAHVVPCRVDVTDPERLTDTVAQLIERFGPVRGVVHAAGVAGGGTIARTTRADVDRVLAAKLSGTVALDAACVGQPLDFFLLCSSVAAILGGFGQSVYSAANAFLDAYAHARRRGDVPMTAVDWGRWDGVGMAAVPVSSGAPAAPEPEGEPTRHPLLRRLPGPELEQVYASRFTTADSWIVADHRILGHGLVPGTAYLELVRAALAERAGPDRVVELHDVLFVQPVLVPDGQARTVYTRLSQHDDRVDFAVRSRRGAGGPWRDHATGWASLVPRGEAPVRDLAQVRADCAVREVFDSEEEILRRARASRWIDGPLRFSVGPRWRVLSRLELGRGRLLATLQLPEAFTADLDDYPLHPALLDMAVGIPRLDTDEPNYLPLGYGRVRVLGGLTGATYCHATITSAGQGTGETLTCDLELLAPDGRVLVEIEGYTVKRVNDVAALTAQVQRAVQEDSAAGVGVAAGSAGVLQPDLPEAVRILTRAMAESDAVGAFGRLITADRLPAQVVLCPGDLADLRRSARSFTPDMLTETPTATGDPGQTHPRPALDTPLVAPRTELETVVAGVWQEVLGVAPIGVEDDFFALGGHSLAAVQIGTRLRGVLGIDVELKSFYDTPTVAHLATLLQTGTGLDPQRSPDPAPDVIELVDRGSADDAAAHLEELSDEDVDARLRELLAQDAGDRL